MEVASECKVCLTCGVTDKMDDVDRKWQGSFFGPRWSIAHLLFWTLSVALMHQVLRFLPGMGSGGGSSAEQTMLALAYGTVVGIGGPAILVPHGAVRFWEHPARILWGLSVAMVVLDLCQQCLADEWRVYTEGIPPSEACAMGAHCTAAVWSLYALTRSKISLGWKFGLALLVIDQCVRFFLLGFSVLFSRGVRGMTAWDPIVLQVTLGAAMSLIVCLYWMVMAGIDWWTGKHRDWQSATLLWLLPAITLAPLIPGLYELYRGWRLGLF